MVYAFVCARVFVCMLVVCVCVCVCVCSVGVAVETSDLKTSLFTMQFFRTEESPCPEFGLSSVPYFYGKLNICHSFLYRVQTTRGITLLPSSNFSIRFPKLTGAKIAAPPRGQ